MVHLFNHFLHQSTAYKQKQIKIQTGWPTLFCLRYLFIYLFIYLFTYFELIFWLAPTVGSSAPVLEPGTVVAGVQMVQGSVSCPSVEWGHSSRNQPKPTISSL